MLKKVFKLFYFLILFQFYLFYCNNYSFCSSLDDNVVNEISKIIEEKWFYSVTAEKKEKIKEDIIKVIFNNLKTKISNSDDNFDKHTSFLNEEQFFEINKIFTSFNGIGIKLLREKNYFKIFSILEDSPAENVLMKGDILLKINNNDLENKTLQEVIKLLKFNKDEKVQLLIKRKKEILLKEIIINEIKIKSTHWEIKNNVLILKIDFFTNNTYKEILQIIELNKDYFKIKEFATTKVPFILDLRDNPGGSLDSCIQIAELFLKKGKIITSIFGKDKKLIHKYVSNNENPILANTVPIVLINKNSASASEILTASLKENIEFDNNFEKNNIVVIGENSYGKSSVQEMINFNKGAIKITIAKYYTPFGKDIDQIGITPDLIIKEKNKNYKNKYSKNYEKEYEESYDKSSQDEIIEKAFEVIKNIKFAEKIQ